MQSPLQLNKILSATVSFVDLQLISIDINSCVGCFSVLDLLQLLEMKNLQLRAIIALVILCIQQAQSLQCYVCLSAVSFDDCSTKAQKIDCDSPPPDLPFPFTTSTARNGNFACGKGSGSGSGGQVFMKSCIPKMTETEFCALLTAEVEADGKVDVCKVCNDNLCNASSTRVLTGALLLLTVGLIFRT